MNNAASPLYPADNPSAVAHINLLQGIINRLANNSASSKTWCLTLVGALVSLAGATHVSGIVTFCLVPIVIFGFIDTMYLAQEKAYRELYGRVIQKLRSNSYDLKGAYEAKAPLKFEHFGSSLKSWSIWPVYGVLVITYVVAHLAGWIMLLSSATGK